MLWRREKCLAPLGIKPRFLGLPTRSPSLYRLSYPEYKYRVFLINGIKMIQVVEEGKRSILR
jgi:hypothetical protein